MNFNRNRVRLLFSPSFCYAFGRKRQLWSKRNPRSSREGNETVRGTRNSKYHRIVIITIAHQSEESRLLL